MMTMYDSNTEVAGYLRDVEFFPACVFVFFRGSFVVLIQSCNNFDRRSLECTSDQSYVKC